MPEKYLFETPIIKEKRQILREFLDYERKIVLDNIRDVVAEADIYTAFGCRLGVPENVHLTSGTIIENPTETRQKRLQEIMNYKHTPKQIDLEKQEYDIHDREKQ